MRPVQVIETQQPVPSIHSVTVHSVTFVTSTQTTNQQIISSDEGVQTVYRTITQRYPENKNCNIVSVNKQDLPSESSVSEISIVFNCGERRVQFTSVIDRSTS